MQTEEIMQGHEPPDGQSIQPGDGANDATGPSGEQRLTDAEAKAAQMEDAYPRAWT